MKQTRKAVPLSDTSERHFGAKIGIPKTSWGLPDPDYSSDAAGSFFRRAFRQPAAPSSAHDERTEQSNMKNITPTELIDGLTILLRDGEVVDCDGCYAKRFDEWRKCHFHDDDGIRYRDCDCGRCPG